MQKTNPTNKERIPHSWDSGSRFGIQDIQAAGLVLVVVFKSGLKELHELVHIFIVGIR